MRRPRPGWFPPKKTACCLLIAVNVKPAHGGGLGPVVGGEDHLPAEGEAVQCLLSFLDSSLQYFSVTQRVFYLVTHSLRLLLKKLAAFSLYNLDSNGLGILMTNKANISETQCTIQKYFGTFRY